MTREEAIRILKEHKIMFQHDFGWDISTIKALDMAISVLSADGEYIKKEDTIEYLNDLFGEMYHVSFGNVLQSLDSLQTYSFPDSAENKGEWIEESDNYGHSSYFCSRCGTQEGKPSDICPNCKARMSNSEKVRNE